MADQQIRLELSKKSLEYLRRLERLKGQDELYRDLDSVFAKQALIAAGYITKTKLSNNPIKRRTGSLARSVTGVATRVGGAPAMKVGVLRGPAVKYAHTLEEGTVGKGGTLPTIVPKRAKALAMPVGDTLTPAGVDRFGGPRRYPSALKFVPFTRSGIAIGGLYDAEKLKAAQRRARRTGAEFSLKDVGAVYLLLRKLDIKPYKFLSKGFTEYLPRLAAAIGEALKKMIS